MMESDKIQLDEEQRENVREYLRFLHEEDGWSDMIFKRWKDEVKDVLTKKYPKMTEDEWKFLESILFI